MAIDPQKEALYAAKTQRASLYAQMFLLQRTNAPVEQIDAIVALIGTTESEIARMADEVNDTVWYKNYSKMLALLEKQSEVLPQLLDGQKETHSGIAALSERFQSLAETVQQLEEDVRNQDKRHESQITVLSNDLAIVKKIVEARPAQRKKEAAAYEERQVAIESRQSEVEAQLLEMRGDYTPEERTRLIGSLIELLAWWDTTHGNG